MSQALRDLKWALSAPQMIDNAHKWYPIIDPFAQTKWIDDLEHAPAPLEQHIQAHPTKRLGLYYEQLVKFAFEQTPNLELLMHNQPVYDGKRTIGAFDFIYQNSQAEVIHRECAVKYYLGIPQSQGGPSDWSQWWGPNKADRLDLKLDKLLNKQIKLGETKQAQQLLNSKQIKIDRKEIDLKGYLFYPLGQHMKQPKDFSPSHIKKYWLTPSHISQLNPSSFWEVLPKLRWLSPACAGKRLLDTQQLAHAIDEYFTKNPSPVLVGEYADNQIGQPELNRYFITPQHWQTSEGKHESSL